MLACVRFRPSVQALDKKKSGFVKLEFVSWISQQFKIMPMLFQKVVYASIVHTCMNNDRRVLGHLSLHLQNVAEQTLMESNLQVHPPLAAKRILQQISPTQKI
jgi:hypothetical protein